MRIAILSRSRTLHSVRRLLEEAVRFPDVAIDVVNPLECGLAISHRKDLTVTFRGTELPRYASIIPRIGASITEYGLAIVRQFELMGVPVVNPSSAIAESRNKLWSLQILASHGVPVPTTLLAKTLHPDSHAVIRELGELPVVLKQLRGTQGVGVMLVHTPASLQSVHETLRGLGQDLLIQQFVSASAGTDIRALVVGDRVVAAMQRKASNGEFRANIHQGGEARPVQLSREQEAVALKSAQTLGLQIAGVDLLIGEEGPLVIEVNSSPGLEGIEHATGKNVARAIIEHTVRSVK